MANKLQVSFSCIVVMDGTSSSVDIDLSKGAVQWSSVSGAAVFSPTFDDKPSGIGQLFFGSLSTVTGKSVSNAGILTVTFSSPPAAQQYSVSGEALFG